MDFLLITLAVSCWVMTSFKNMFALIASLEFIATSTWYLSGISDPWWFIIYAVINCVFCATVALLVPTKQGKKYAWTLVVSAGLAMLVFCEYWVSGSFFYDWRRQIMTAICIYQLWLVATSSGLMECITDGPDPGSDLRGSGLGRHHQTPNLAKET